MTDAILRLEGERPTRSASPPGPSAMQNGIRRLAVADLDAVLQLQQATLPDAMAARLGEKFRVLYFRATLEETRCFTDGFFVSGALAGFLSYTADTSSLLRRIVRRHPLSLVWSMVAGVARSPSVMPMVARIAAAVFARLPEPGAEYPAEVLSIAVLPEYRGRREEGGRSLRVAHELVQHAFITLRDAGISHVRALVKLEEVDPVARRFWEREGCVFVGRTQRYGIATDFLLKDLHGEATT